MREFKTQSAEELRAMGIAMILEADARITRDKRTLTLDDVKADPWNAVYLALPKEAPPDFLKEVRKAALFCLETQAGKFRAARAGELAPAGYFEGPDPKPDAHEFYEQAYLDALNRVELLDFLLEPK
jgi:hypothetical protein